MKPNEVLELANKELAEADESLRGMSIMGDADKLNCEIAYLSLQVATLTKVIAELACPLVEAIMQPGFVFKDGQETTTDLQGEPPQD